MFSRSGNPLLLFLQSYHVWVISKIQVNFRFKTYLEVLVNMAYRFLKFLHHLCFWGQRIIWWHFYWATMFGRPQKFSSLFGSKGFRGYPNIRSLIKKSSEFISCRAKVAGRSHDQRFIVNFIFMSPNAMSCHIMSRQVTSCYVMSRNFTSCHVMPRHVTSCHVMSHHVMSCHVVSRHATSRNVTSYHITSCHVILRHITSKVTGRSHDQRFIVNWLLPHAINSN